MVQSTEVPLREPDVGGLPSAKRILLAGAGGGFDLFSGLPLFFALRARGVQVHLANLSFSRLDRATGRRLSPALLEVTADSQGQERYFPELHLCRYLRRQGMEQPIYCFERTGVRLVTDAYRVLADMLEPDAVSIAGWTTPSIGPRAW